MVLQYTHNKLDHIESYKLECINNIQDNKFIEEINSFKNQFYQQMNNILNYNDNIYKSKAQTLPIYKIFTTNLDVTSVEETLSPA